MSEKFESTNGAPPSTEFERSIARSAAASGDTSSKAAAKAPLLVDGHGSALRQTGSNEAEDQLQALKSELEKLRQSVASISATARGMVTEKVDVTIADVEETLKRNVFASVGIAALLGYLWSKIR